jgi:hypothetical protein
MSWITWGQARAYSALQAGPAGTLCCKPGSFFAGSLGWRGIGDPRLGLGTPTLVHSCVQELLDSWIHQSAGYTTRIHDSWIHQSTPGIEELV